MFEFRDLFQWDRFITPTIIKTFYWLVIALIGLFGISGIFSGLATMAISPFGGFILLLSLMWMLLNIPRARAMGDGKGEFSRDYFTPVDLVGLYWHLVDLIWIFLWPLFYLA